MTAGQSSRGPISLPKPPKPSAAYVPARRTGRLLFVAGQLPFVDGALPVTGKLGAELSTEEGLREARQAGLNSLAVAAEAAGGPENLRAVQLTVYVASTPDYYEQHIVANGASNALTEVLGEAGEHSRTTIATPCLAMNSPVEIQALFEITGSADR